MMTLLDTQIQRAVEELATAPTTKSRKHFPGFRAAIAANPDSLRLFYRFACEVRKHGFVKYSADAIYHRMRWETNMTQTPGAAWKFNDHYRTFYGRLLPYLDPSFRDFFDYREPQQ